jgi:hypothetical protein
MIMRHSDTVGGMKIMMKKGLKNDGASHRRAFFARRVGIGVQLGSVFLERLSIVRKESRPAREVSSYKK